MSDARHPAGPRAWLDLGDDLHLGVDADGAWLIGSPSKGERHVLTSFDDYRRLLVLLKRPYADILGLIEAYRTSQSVSSTFPMEAVVRAGLIFKTEYWASLAVRWFPSLAPEQRSKLASELKDVALSTWASQKTRQLALREYRRAMLH